MMWGVVVALSLHLACELHNPVPVDPDYPPLACGQTQCRPARSIDQGDPWDAGDAGKDSR